MTRHAVVFAAPAEATPVVAGVSILERLLRTLARAGVADVLVLGTEGPGVLEAALARDGRARPGLSVRIVRAAGSSPQLDALRRHWPERAERLLVLPSPAILDLRLLKALLHSARPAALVDSARPPGHASGFAPEPPGPLLLDREVLARWRDADLGAAVAAALDAGEIEAIDVARVPSYIPSMRRALRPFWLAPPRDEAERLRAQQLVIGAAQKKALDFPAYVHAPIEDALVRAVCTTGITPNQVSFAGNVVAYAATALFAVGALGWAITLALVVGVLDGVDGKLARVKVETSEAGRLEHWFDTFFEVSWAVALASWLARSGVREDAWWLLLLLLGAEAVDGAAKGAIILGYGRQIDDVAAFDRLVRLVGGRRNVYVWMLAVGIAAGMPGPAFALVAWWEAATAVVHVLRAAWLLAARRKGRVG